MLNPMLLDRIDDVYVITGESTLRFARLSGARNHVWLNPVKGEYVDGTQAVELLQGYAAAGCVVLPISREDEPAMIFTRTAYDDWSRSYIRAALGESHYVEVRLGGKIISSFWKVKPDHWNQDDTYRVDDDELVSFVASRVRDDEYEIDFVERKKLNQA